MPGEFHPLPACTVTVRYRSGPAQKVRALRRPRGWKPQVGSVFEVRALDKGVATGKALLVRCVGVEGAGTKAVFDVEMVTADVS